MTRVVTRPTMSQSMRHQPTDGFLVSGGGQEPDQVLEEPDDPAADRWQMLPAPGLLPQGATTAFWTGSRLVAMDYQLDARAFDLTTGMWTDLPKLPFPARECYPTSTIAPDPPILFDCGATVQLTGTGWRQLPDGPRGRKPAILAVGHTLITINQKLLQAGEPVRPAS